MGGLWGGRRSKGSKRRVRCCSQALRDHCNWRLASRVCRPAVGLMGLACELAKERQLLPQQTPQRNMAGAGPTAALLRAAHHARIVRRMLRRRHGTHTAQQRVQGDRRAGQHAYRLATANARRWSQDCSRGGGPCSQTRHACRKCMVLLAGRAQKRRSRCGGERHGTEGVTGRQDGLMRSCKSCVSAGNWSCYASQPLQTQSNAACAM